MTLSFILFIIKNTDLLIIILIVLVRQVGHNNFKENGGWYFVEIIKFKVFDN